MADLSKVFRDSFHNDEEGKRYGSADYTTNTFRICETPDYEDAEDLMEMSLIHAFVSREEFMHGEWSVPIVNSCARLRVAAIDALYEAIETPERQAELLDLFDQVYQTVGQLDAVLEPFQEAVDKLQILSVVGGDEEFRETVADTYRDVRDEFDLPAGEVESIDVELEKRIDYQKERAMGVRGPRSRPSTDDDDHPMDLYVNPLYTFALLDAANPSEDLSSYSDPDEFDIEALSQNRFIIETVARVVLDVPFPIAPLSETHDYEPLRVEGVDFAPIDVESLNRTIGRADRYAVSDADLREYLLTYTDLVVNREFNERLGTTPHEYNDSWLDAVLVTTLKELEQLAQEEEVDITEMEDERLRRKLRRRVHEVDFDEQTTMAKFPTHLIKIPARASRESDEDDLLSDPSDPVSKVVVEAFGQHGSFGAVVFDPDDANDSSHDDNDNSSHQMNFYAMEYDEVNEHPDVRSSVDSYEEIWDRYYFGKHVANHILDEYENYVDTLRRDIAAEVDDADQLESKIDDLEPPADDSEMSQPVVRHRRGARAQERETLDILLEETSDDGDTVKASDSTDGVDEDVMQKLADQPVWRLQSLAEITGVQYEPLSNVVTAPECPLCEIVAQEPCGGEECKTKELRDDLDDRLPEILTHLVQPTP